MDKTVKIKIVRESDSSSFTIGTDEDWRLLKDGLDGFAEIENTLSFTDNAIADGGIITSEHVSSKDRTIQFCYLKMSENETARKKALAFFNVHDTFKVYLTYGERTVWAEAKLYKLSCPMSADVTKRLDFTITFMFASPYWNSYENYGKNIASLVGKMAFPYMSNPAFGGVTGGVFNFAQQVILTNDGDIEAYCEVVIECADGNVINPKIIINDEYVRVIDTMTAGDVIVMNFAAFPPTVTKNDVNFMGHCDRTSAFDSMALQRGSNVIKYDADNGSSHMNVTVYYYKQYGAI